MSQPSSIKLHSLLSSVKLKLHSLPSLYANTALLKMDVLVKSGSIHFKISLIVTEIVG